MSADVLVILAALALAGYFGGAAFVIWRTQRKFARMAAAAPPPAAPVTTAPTPSRWCALPDNKGRIELEATGFFITLHPHANEAPGLYRLWTPEGLLLWHGIDLPLGKSIGERFAAERAEFACPAPAHLFGFTRQQP